MVKPTLGGYFEKFEGPEAGNFRQRYQGTYGFFQNEGKEPVMVRINTVEDRVEFTDKRGASYTLLADRPGNIGFEFLPPKSQWYNTPKGALYTERVVARRWQRGVCDNNTKIYLLQGGRPKPVAVGFEWLEHIFLNSLTGSEALKKFVAQETPSLSLSPSFAIDHDKLFVLAAQVGKVISITDKKLAVSLDDPELWKTELSDACRNLSITLEIV